MAVFQHLDDAVAGQVQVVAGVSVGAVRETVEREGKHEGAVDALGLEDLQHLAQVGGLTLLVSDVLAVQPGRRAGFRVVLDNLQAASAPVARAVAGGRAELADRNRLALRDERTHAVGEPVGDLDRPVEIHGHDVEGSPVDALKLLHGGVGELAAEPLADERRGLGQELVDARGDLGDQLAQAMRRSVRS